MAIIQLQGITGKSPKKFVVKIVGIEDNKGNLQDQLNEELDIIEGLERECGKDEK